MGPPAPQGAAQNLLRRVRPRGARRRRRRRPGVHLRVVRPDVALRDRDLRRDGDLEAHHRQGPRAHRRPAAVSGSERPEWTRLSVEVPRAVRQGKRAPKAVSYEG